MRTSSTQAGFTLIELMITVALSSMIGVLIYTVFINQTQAYRAQADMGSMQQNLRVAMEMMSRDLGSAGFGLGNDGTARGFEGQAGIDSDPLYAVRVRENFPSGAGSDAVEILMLNPDRDQWGWKSKAMAACTTTEITFHDDHVTRAGNFATGGENDVIMCYAPTGNTGQALSYVWSVNGSGDASSGIVPVSANTEADFTATCAQNLPEQMICGPARYIAYYIDDVSDSIGIGSQDLPVLYLVNDLAGLLAAGGVYPDDDDIPVALGIEDLQIEICQGGVSAVDCNEPSGDLASPSWTSGLDLSTSVWENITSARLHLVARTIRPDQTRANVSSPLDVDLDDSSSTAGDPDGYHRRVARTEVVIRNAVGAWQVARAPY
jgi:prepilin-type N-terminal cleavage/methylation domain-containing protein